MTYTIVADGMPDGETHSNKDDVIIALLAILNGFGVSALVTWPDGFTAGMVK